MEKNRRFAGMNSKVSREQVLQAARRHFHHGESLGALAEGLGISPSHLGRLLKAAQDRGDIRVHIAARVETELSAELLRRYPGLRRADVVPRGETPEATARAIGGLAGAWLETEIETDEEREPKRIRNVAIGGAWPHRFLLQEIAPHPNRISVGPTALTPSAGRMDRWTAPVLAAWLAQRLDALTPGDRGAVRGERTGFLYNLTVDPPRSSLSALRDWYAELNERQEYGEMLGFWSRCDAVFVSVVGVDYIYKDVEQRLAALGLSAGEMKARGAVALVANQFVDGQGNLVPLADGVPTYEPAIPVDTLRAISRGIGREPGWVVLDAWGRPAACTTSILNTHLANYIISSRDALTSASDDPDLGPGLQQGFVIE